jgi:hypothetical protein
MSDQTKVTITVSRATLELCLRALGELPIKVGVHAFNELLVAMQTLPPPREIAQG